jgi:hypothetical protein
LQQRRTLIEVRKLSLADPQLGIADADEAVGFCRECILEGAMSEVLYTIRYRSALYPDSVRLIVEDAAGKYYLFACNPDNCSLLPMTDTERPKSNFSELGWFLVPQIQCYTLDALRGLMAGALFTHHLPPALTAVSPVS